MTIILRALRWLMTQEPELGTPCNCARCLEGRKVLDLIELELEKEKADARARTAS